MRMERINSRENFLLGYAAQRAFESPSSVPKSPFRSSDVDFNDAFGGPPRRFSLHETRYSSDGPMDYEETVLFRGLSGEKPAKSYETNMRRNLRDNSKNTEAPTDINEFHFSIYKWASSGVPIVMPLRKGISSKSKEKDELARSSSSKGRIRSDTVCELLPANACSTDTHSISVKSEFSKRECEKLVNTITLEGAETCLEEVIVKPESDILETTQVSVETFPDCTMLSNKSETKPNSLPDKVFTVTEEARKLMLKPLRSIIRDEIDGQENEDIVMQAEGKENVAKTTKVSHSNVDASKDVKKHDGKIINSNKPEVNKASIQGSPNSPGSNIKRIGVRGKVKDFVKIFNQETSSKTKSNAYTQNQSCRWEGKVSGAKVNEASISTTEMDVKMHLPIVNKIPDISFVKDENIEKPEKHLSHVKSTIHTNIDNSSDQEEASPFSFQSQMKSTINTSNDNSSDLKEASPFSESIPDGSKVTRESIDDPFQVNYLMQELPDDQIKLSQTSKDPEATKSLDAKIRKWSSGKKGNIRSLLSTLQYVLWEDSGWKPVPLVNIIEGNAVKRAYQKALLCPHPDKLQQKGAASLQKYTAEKVFDILQEAWDHFNSLGSI